MIIETTVARLIDEVDVLKLVGGAAQFAQAMEGLTTVPAAFVMPASEQSSSIDWSSGGVVVQSVTATFAVAIAVRNLADARGKAAIDSVTAIRLAIRDALLGWVPLEDFDGLEFDGGNLTEFRDGNLWWTDTYRTAYSIRSV